MNFEEQFEDYSFPTLGLVRLPSISVPAEDKEALGLSPKASNQTYLKHLAWYGFQAKKDKFKATEEEVKARLKMEFEVFEKTGIIDYLLLVWDILKWCDKQGYPRGPGRGSVSGSCAAYCLDITAVNPLTHNLNFTRFLSEARAKPKVIDGIIYVDGKNLCDIDSDISYSHRDEVIKYIDEKYKGRTCKISTRLQLTGKTALKDVLKVYLEYGEERAKHITDNLEAHFGKMEGLENALEKHKELKEWTEENPENLVAFKIAQQLEGLNFAKGQHPSGICVYYDPIEGNAPVELSRTKEVVSSYDMEVVAGQTVKLDLLGLRTLDVLDEAAKLTGIKVADIDVNDQCIYDYLKATDLYEGLFQIESGLTKEVTKKVQPRNLDDLAACLAISRPGALAYIGDFIKYVHEGVFKTIYPAIDDILKPTGGLLLYQESVMEIAQKVYGLTPDDSNELRRSMGKKEEEEMKKWEEPLIAKGKERNIPEEVTKYFWGICRASADYLFSLNHCVSYAYITAQTTYIKAKHPSAFYLALLRMSKHEQSPLECVNSIVQEMRQMNIAILPPSLGKSATDFEFEGDAIRMGLSNIKGISDAVMDKLKKFSCADKSKFKVFEAAKEAKVPINVLVGLIYCGALETNGISRSRLALEAQTYNLLTDREKVLVHHLAEEYKHDLLNIVKALTEKLNEKGKPYIKESRFATIRRDYEPFKRIYQENSKNEMLACFIYEKTFLGFSYTTTLRSIFESRCSGLMEIRQIKTEAKDTPLKYVGFVDEIERRTSREKKTNYLLLSISDETGSIKTLLYGDSKIESFEQFHSEGVDEGAIVIVRGKKGEGDAVFAESIVKQHCAVVIKASKLEKEEKA